VARDRAEAQRLAYVAATRARDLLVVPAVGDAPYDGGWLEALTPAIYPPQTDRRSPRPAPGVPLFKSKDTVLNRPNGDPATPGTVAPGTFVFSARPDHQVSKSPAHEIDYEVTWWDPRALHLDAAPPFGLRRDDLIVKTGDLFGVDERLADYERWRDSRAAVMARASAPSVRFTTATAWAAKVAELGVDTVLVEEPDAERAITILEIPGAATRPRGPRFGSLVHGILATVPLTADEPLIARTASIHARLLNAGADEIGASIGVVSAVLRHELIERARASSSVKRETPVSWLNKDGTLIEGVLDLAFEESGGTVVVDFKTDHELSAGETRYRAQLLQYVTAVARATGRPASGVLFRV
jgi:hypothetical protein